MGNVEAVSEEQHISKLVTKFDEVPQQVLNEDFDNRIEFCESVTNFINAIK